MNVAITYAGPDPSRELRSLREWLPKADPRLTHCLREQTEGADGHLGADVVIGLVLAGISAAQDLTGLYKGVAGWVHNRFGWDVDTRRQVETTAGEGSPTVTTVKVAEVTITITTPPGQNPPVVPHDGD